MLTNQKRPSSSNPLKNKKQKKPGLKLKSVWLNLTKFHTTAKEKSQSTMMKRKEKKKKTLDSLHPNQHLNINYLISHLPKRTLKLSSRRKTSSYI